MAFQQPASSSLLTIERAGMALRLRTIKAPLLSARPVQMPHQTTLGQTIVCTVNALVGASCPERPW